MEWQKDKTAGEISLIQFVLHVRQHLDPAPVTHIASKTKEELLAEVRWLLKWYGVEK